MVLPARRFASIPIVLSFTLFACGCARSHSASTAGEVKNVVEATPSATGETAASSALVPAPAEDAMPGNPPADAASASSPDGTRSGGDGGATQEGMVLVPAGTFTMGADRGGQDDEHPAHAVTLKAFFLDKTEVTNGAYAACVTAKVCRPPDPKSAKANRFGRDELFRGAQQPVSSISWDEARAYCQWLGKRLPREAEWERAARGADGRTFPWGNEEPTRERGVYGAGCTEDVGTHPAGAGPYGHMDMAGNVWEWLEDIYDPYAYRRSGAPRGEPGTCEEVQAAQDELRRNGRQGFTGSNPIPVECEHVLRGGAFNYDAPGLRSSNRVHHPGHFRLVMSGVRCAKDAE